VKCVKIPAQSPKLQSSPRSGLSKRCGTSALRHFVFFGERHLRFVLKEFMAHYHRERFHQGLGGQLIEARVGSTSDKGARGKVVCRSRLGGMLNFYYREAA